MRAIAKPLACCLAGILLLLSCAGCGETAQDTSSEEPAGSSSQAPEVSAESTASSIDSSREAAEIMSSDEGDAQPSEHMVAPKSTVTNDPPHNIVTYEIDKSLIGKYAVPDDPEMYFEIKEDGSVELSLNAFSGYAFYDKNLSISAFYTDSRTILCFSVSSGTATLPASELSITFTAIKDRTVFYTQNDMYDELDFVKQ